MTLLQSLGKGMRHSWTGPKTLPSPTFHFAQGEIVCHSPRPTVVAYEFSALCPWSLNQGWPWLGSTASAASNSCHSILVSTRWETQEVIFIHRRVQRYLLSRKEGGGLPITQEYSYKTIKNKTKQNQKNHILHTEPTCSLPIKLSAKERTQHKGGLVAALGAASPRNAAVKCLSHALPSPTHWASYSSLVTCALFSI